MNHVGGGNLKSISVRIPDDLWKEIEKLAKEEERSFNKMIVYLIKRALGKGTKKR